MNWIKKVFKKKPKKKTKEQIDIEQQFSGLRSDGKPLRECFVCKSYILEGDRWSKQGGKWFHKKCYKELIKTGGAQ